ncbi:MAG: hypothetical protein H0T15_00880, partial [Thermoleophilaceae bacterium]|nr:hypothetical protein [Thermoleophilaceae bacterium]
AGRARLVLAESYSKGWRAYCDGRDLGEPEPAEGFANSWEAPADCAAVRFAFGPQRVAGLAYWISILGGMLLLALVAVSARRHRFTVHSSQFTGSPPADPAIRAGWSAALALGFLAALAGGFLFALRAGVVIGPAVVVALRVGITRKRLLTAAAIAMAAIAVVYLVFPPENPGGYSFNYALELVAAHWLGVAAVICLGSASALGARAVRRSTLTTDD